MWVLRLNASLFPCASSAKEVRSTEYLAYVVVLDLGDLYRECSGEYWDAAISCIGNCVNLGCISLNCTE